MPILTQDEVIAELKAHVQRAGSVRKVAKRIDMSRQSLYEVLKGKRAPGPRILAFLNLQKETATSVAYRMAPPPDTKEAA